MKLSRHFPVSWLLLTACLLPGCWEKSTGITSVHGHVYFNDKLLTRGTIVFTPDAERGGKGDMASAEIQSDGSYILKAKNGATIEAGWHRVTVLALEATDPSGSSNNFREPKSLIPDKYRDPNLCGLSVEVIPDQENVRDLHLD
jgi:hypothetical protein